MHIDEESQAIKILRAGLSEDSGSDDQAQGIANLIGSVSRRRLPVNSFFRIWILGTLQAKVAFGYLAYWLRSRFAGLEERQRRKNEAHLSAALQLLATMGYLRGAVMKVGQMLANLPEVVPEEFAEVLSALHFEAPAMHYSMVREVFWDEFGQEPEEVFASFDRQAFAAASLGQVHRARLHSGEEVAVKIQYPGIARTITADLRNLRLLLQPMCFSKEWSDTVAKLADIERMLLQETDYEQEARFGQEARAAFSQEDEVVVPRVYEGFCTKRVLTAEYLPGMHLSEYLATNPSQVERDRFTTLLTVATLRLYYRNRWFLADPHPGNFIFMADGRLGVIDFGCTRVMSESEWQLACAAEQATLAGDEAGLDRVTAEACLFASPAAMAPDHLATIRRGVDWQMEPWLHEGLFDFGNREFFRRGVDYLVEATRKRYTQGAPLYLWSNRFLVGGRAFCYRLRGRCEFKKIHRQELAAWYEHCRPAAAHKH